ncbi:phage tail protein [Roseococcus pinisoli]|uniref:Uncharacterized protein n=1 Tax=Roseococcus pinisoli TaxID=2835040 RepID=A0ABS5QFS5_9PROT|nr:phage tail protein [Roseococcus pinisoli]MBS7812353.1 hypothetical protein [Roseococcus pinisoli]
MSTEIEFDFRTKRYTDAAAGLNLLAVRMGRSLETVGVPTAREELTAYLGAAGKALATRHGGAWPTATGPKTLSKRTGNLVKSIQDSVSVEGTTLNNLRGVIGSNLIYAKTQENGATIVPKHSKYLAIPLPAAMDSRGVPLKPSPRSWDHTFVAKSKAGNLIIFRREGTQVIPLYVLKSKVYVPPRLGLRATLESNLSFFVDRLGSRLLEQLRLDIAKA